MQLTTLFGTTQLLLQSALRRNLDAAASTPRVPNFIVVTLRRTSFMAEYDGAMQDQLARFRRDLEAGMRSFVSAHGWSIGGSGTVVLNILLGSIATECEVEARIARSFYELLVEDDRGPRTIMVGSNPAMVGRDHEFPPRGFIALHDRDRLLSREHLRLTYADLALRGRLLGRNPTTLNGVALAGDSAFDLKDGDEIACGSCRITIGGLVSRP